MWKRLGGMCGICVVMLCVVFVLLIFVEEDDECVVVFGGFFFFLAIFEIFCGYNLYKKIWSFFKFFLKNPNLILYVQEEKCGKRWVFYFL